MLNLDIIDVLDNEVVAQRCTGTNEKKILIVFQTGENEAAMRAFLAKMLAAAQLDLEKDVCTLSIMPFEKISFSRLRHQFDIQTCLAFGIPPEHLGIYMQIKPYELLEYNALRFVFVDDLQAVFEERQQGGKQMSGALWKVLQMLFLK